MELGWLEQIRKTHRGRPVGMGSRVHGCPGCDAWRLARTTAPPVAGLPPPRLESGVCGRNLFTHPTGPSCRNRRAIPPFLLVRGSFPHRGDAEQNVAVTDDYLALQEEAKSLPQRSPEEVARDEERILRLVSAVEWSFAKTMPQVPHEYCVFRRNPELADEFAWFTRHILAYGKVESWGPYLHSYLYFRGHKYWTMDGRISETTLVNRESTTDVPCRLGQICEH